MYILLWCTTFLVEKLTIFMLTAARKHIILRLSWPHLTACCFLQAKLPTILGQLCNVANAKQLLNIHFSHEYCSSSECGMAPNIAYDLCFCLRQKSGYIAYVLSFTKANHFNVTKKTHFLLQLGLFKINIWKSKIWRTNEIDKNFLKIYCSKSRMGFYKFLHLATWLIHSIYLKCFILLLNWNWL